MFAGGNTACACRLRRASAPSAVSFSTLTPSSAKPAPRHHLRTGAWTSPPTSLALTTSVRSQTLSSLRFSPHARGARLLTHQRLHASPRPQRQHQQLSDLFLSKNSERARSKVLMSTSAAEVPTSEGQQAPTEQVVQLLQDAEAVCFDVDSTVCNDEGMRNVPASLLS
mmetsp:Transcript_12460/g.45429  ORF Transcript_12460/g.45429 Transcript_12460/m.45429 type:complete len:168 (+) Transcript_12460:160-663(+)